MALDGLIAPLFGEHTGLSVGIQVIQGWRPEMPVEIEINNPLLACLIRECWDECPERRPSFIDIQSKLDGMRQSIDAGGTVNQ